MIVVGLSAYYHDSAASLVRDGHVVAAAQEERFTRRKHDAGFPEQALKYCLAAAGVSAREVDHFVFYDKPFLKFERLLETYLAFAPRGFGSFAASLPVWVKDKLFQRRALVGALGDALGRGVDYDARLLFSEHHLSHAASAFFPSPFDEALVLTLDGVGEWATTSLAVGRGNRLDVHREINFPHSLGLLYSAFTAYTGFKVNSGEYKVMGLAPYGVPRYADLIRDELIDVKPDGSYRLNLAYFDFCTGLRMTNDRFATLFGGAPRAPEDPLTQRDMDLAASIQCVTEDVVARLVAGAVRQTGLRNLCMAGGVALNCVANGKVLQRGLVDRIWIQPAAGDAGGSLGAALAVHHIVLGAARQPASPDAMQGGYLGPDYSQREIEETLAGLGASFRVLSDDALIAESAELLAQGKALGWHQGRMEFGPRALGARSILADPRRADMQKTLNLRVKFRESFRPFAPSVLRERLADWFDLDADSPYMLLVADVAARRRHPISAAQQALFGIERLNCVRSDIPAVTHVDGSARVQTVHAETNPRYHALIRQFERLTGCPVLVNTSFNVRGEPIVMSPADAFRCFMGTGIEALAMGNCLLEKDRQDASLATRYAELVEPD